MKAIMGKLANVARSQSHRDKRVTMTATLANGRQVTIRAEGSIEDWVKVIMKAMYQGKNNALGANPIVGSRMNVTEYQIADGLSLVSKEKRIGNQFT